ncbi:hypothetical protein [Methyloversatilis universalis]|uniref:hypothetical protein n=1 Tax=Methyloversatilis universalis TaxID=378211 RepID=UPI00036B120E|nr:hypothetical protein [Methyloversatilis universalis]
MNAPARFLLILMLLCALPLQGFAAASMLRCAPSHHGSTQVDTSAYADEGHHHDPSMPAVHPTHDGEPAHGADHAPAHGKYGCSACAACCIGGALASPAPLLPASAHLHERPLPVPQPAAAFITEGPERPPRHLPA